MYMTDRLPTSLTEGKEEIGLRVVSWNAAAPTMGLYRAYTHTDPMFDLPGDETGSTYDIGTPAGPNSDGVQPVRDEIEDVVSRMQQKSRTGGDRKIVGLSMAYQHHDWIDAVDKEQILEIVKNDLDYWVVRQAQADSVDDSGAGWKIHGEHGQALVNTYEGFEEAGLLDTELELSDNNQNTFPDGHPDAPITRREAYTQFLKNGYEWRKQSRRGVTNQVMYVGMSLIRANRALMYLDESRARPESKIDRLVDETFGIEGLSVIDEGYADGPYYQTGSYHHITEAGLEKEQGYAVGYGTSPIVQSVYFIDETEHDERRERVRGRLQDAREARGNLR